MGKYFIRALSNQGEEELDNSSFQETLGLTQGRKNG